MQKRARPLAFLFGSPSSGVQYSSPRDSLRVPHAPAALTTQSTRAPDPKGHFVQVLRRAETCTTARVLVWLTILWSPVQLTTRFPPSAARIRGPNNSVNPCPRPRRPLLPSCAARGKVQDHSRSQAASHRPRVGNCSGRASPGAPRLCAALVTPTRIVYYCNVDTVVLQHN